MKLKSVLRGVILATALLTCVQGMARATSLYSLDSVMSSMYADNKARTVGDLITILVMESSYSQNRTQTTTSKGLGVDAKPGIGPFDFIPAARLEVGNSSRGSSANSRSGRLVATLTAQVVEILPNGDFVIKGVREVSVNREKEYMIITGTIRPRDISPNNTIPSSLVANAEIAFTGGTYTGQKGGFFKNLWDGIVTVFNWIF